MKKIFFMLLWFPLLIWSQETATAVSRGKIYFHASSSAELLYATSGIGEWSGGETFYLVQAGGGYTFTDQWVAGLNLRLSNFNYSAFASKWLLGPFTRFYFPYRRVLFFAHSGISYGVRNRRLMYEEDPNMRQTQVHTLSYELTAGLAVPLNRTIHFDITAGYDATLIRGKNVENRIQNWGIQLGFSLFLGKSK